MHGRIDSARQCVLDILRPFSTQTGLRRSFLVQTNDDDDDDDETIALLCSLFLFPPLDKIRQKPTPSINFTKKPLGKTVRRTKP
jgi:hypothetical protein